MFRVRCRASTSPLLARPFLVQRPPVSHSTTRSRGRRLGSSLRSVKPWILASFRGEVAVLGLDRGGGPQPASATCTTIQRVVSNPASLVALG